MNFRLKFLIFGLSLLSLHSFASEELRWGPEFEFSNFKMIRDQLTKVINRARGRSDVNILNKADINYEILGALKSIYDSEASSNGFKIEAEFSDEAKTHIESFKVHYPSLDFWFEVTVDPGVIEVKAKPVSLQRWKALAPTLNKDIFGIFKNYGLTPGWGGGFGAGHLNFDGVAAFGEDVQLYRNFLVDYVNNSELALGIQYGMVDRFNATSIASDEKQFNAFVELLQRVDSGEIKTPGELARQFRSKVLSVYSKEEIAAAKGLEQTRMMYPTKYVAFNAHSEGKSKTVNRGEIRAMRQQNSTDDFVKMAEVYEKRIEYLKGKPPIALMSRADVLDRSTFISRYKNYISETGLDWKIYRKAMPFIYRCEAFLRASY